MSSLQPPLIVWTSEAQTPHASMAISTSYSSNFLSGSYVKVSWLENTNVWEATNTNLFPCEGAPILDISDGKSVRGLWIRHLEV